MTISSEVRKAGPFTGNGTASAFPFNFKVFKAADLIVVRRKVDIGAESTLVLNRDYTVALNHDQNANPGGTVTISAGPLASGFTLIISSELPYLQPTDLTNQGGFYPAVVTNALDRLTIFCQQLAERMGRSLKLPITAPGNISTEIPLPNPKELIAWNEAGTGLTTVSPQSLVTSIAYGSAVADLFAGDGVTTTFPLTSNPASVNNLDVSIGGVSQRPVIGGIGDYKWNGGASITFVKPPKLPDISGDKNVLVRYMQAIPVSEGESIHTQQMELFRRSYAEAGYNVVGTFERGFSIKNINDVGIHEETGKGYTGEIGDVIAGTDPISPMFSDVSHYLLRDRFKLIGIDSNVKSHGAKGDGITDDTAAIQSALDTGRIIYMPAGVYIVSDTLKLRARGSGLSGEGQLRTYGSSETTIKWTGASDKTMAVLVMGQNGVGVPPSSDNSDATAIKVKNLYIDCDNKAGFGIYGAYVVNESEIDNVAVSQATEYGIYIVKSWYCKFTNILVMLGKNNGIAFGMPLVYSDGTSPSGWDVDDNLPCNNNRIENIRAWLNGGSFRDGSKTWDVSKPHLGYGVGLGCGYGMNVSTLTSEQNGGVNLFINRPAENYGTNISVSDCYFEDANKGSSLPSDQKVGVYIKTDDVSASLGYEMKNWFINNSSGGGVLIDGKRPIRFDAIHQPKFIKEKDGSDVKLIHGISNSYSGTFDENVIDRRVVNGFKITTNAFQNIPLTPTPITGFGCIEIYIPAGYVRPTSNHDGVTPVAYTTTDIDGGVKTFTLPPTGTPKGWYIISNYYGKPLVSIAMQNTLDPSGGEFNMVYSVSPLSGNVM